MVYINPNNHLYLSLGSDMGDREVFLTEGRQALHENVGQILSVSKIYETEPWKMRGESFLNQVICLYCELSPVETMKRIIAVEKNLGRVRAFPVSRYSGRVAEGADYHPRPIDIDILFYGKRVIQTNELTIPHPLISERRFVLVPLAEIAAGFIHPLLRKPVRELLKACTDTRSVEKWEKENSSSRDSL